MRTLHASTSLSALVLALAAGPALADTTVSTDTTTALVTSSAGNVTMTEDGTITLDSGTAITVDTDAAVDADGGIEMGDADGATGITVRSGTNSTITIGEDATLYVLEDYVPDDDDGNSIADGAIASASNRYGVYVGGDASGTILNEGIIKVEGLNSGGIVLDGTYTGNVTNTGTITVIGDYSTGISTQAIDGNLTVEGTVKAIGEGATGVAVNGDVTGTVTIQGTVTQAASYTDDDGDTIYLSRAALRAGTAAVSISGNVDGGIYVAAPPADDDSSNDDEDGDGVDDSDEGTGAIVSYGNGPALQVGGTNDITIGAVDANVGTYSIAIEGSVAGNAYYSNTAAYGLVIGGEGGNVTLTDGIGVSGTVRATTYDSSATALLINEGSTVNYLYNSGSIAATISSPGEGSTTAIQDLSGTLTTIDNTGFITASGSSTDTRVALDLSANTTGVTINQYLNDDDAETSAEYLEDNDVDVDPTVYTKITGNILLGSGDDTINASSGAIAGNTYFGDGNDTLNLSGDLAYTGDVYFGSGTGTATMAGTSSFTGTMDFAGEIGTLTLNDSATYSGDFANAGNLTVTVNGGTLTPADTSTVSFGTLYVASGGTLGVYVDGDESSTFNVTNATLEDGASITATVSDLADAEGTYTVLTADSLDVEGSLASSVDLPFIFDGTVSSDANSIYLTIERKTASELGLTRAAASAWDAVYATAGNDDDLTSSLLQVEDTETLESQVGGLLPDHAGGVFSAVTSGDRLAARHISDDTTMFDISDVGGWLEPVYWNTTRDAGDTAAYKVSGWGISMGAERRTSIGYVGVSYAWLQSSVTDNGGTGKLDLGQHDFGLFWRTAKGPFMAWARLGGAHVSIDSARTFTGTIDDTDFTYEADGKWSGWLLSGLAGASYRYQASRRFSLKPKVELEQMWLKEKGYEETADSDAIALTVASRTSKALTATPTVTAAYSLGTVSPDWRPLTFQLEAGRREVLSGNLGSTTAYFNGGDSYDAGESFTITPDSLKGAWIGEASVLAGGYDFTWKLTTRVERTSDSTDVSARASLSVAF
ncbi:autotransporter outer membrane beta-barrel domain-containing protein [Novosphingobium album (ex Hu et al. 2023)]|uniref:Autotransporter domain-containing protein n=1 Tax=Novosphingobium album (ex Hu et al. 2023) TaxID=2930093 RepID=A0ABT0B680_9SPHN|nr:autotransporter domain-containing protein [Novosphingobium album (ex Hu et al. 2023)]MCJ2180538.1 autotransporter domain-containing protein [Novosphingobium album (ex Hu et al. 2023)]